MKTFSILAFLVCFALPGNAQTKTDTVSSPTPPPPFEYDAGDKIFERVEEEASFPGGVDG